MGTPSETPFNGVDCIHANRIHRVTFLVGSVKTASHVTHPTGSKGRYDAVRSDSTDPQNIQTPERNRYKTEEA